MAKYNPKHDSINNNEEPYFYLERNMIDEKHQGKGYGKAALRLLIEELRSGNCGKAAVFYTGCEQNNPVTQKFYESFGFIPTGEALEDGEDIEYVARLAFC